MSSDPDAYRVISIRVPAALWSRVQLDAAGAGLTAGEHVRRVLADHAGLELRAPRSWSAPRPVLQDPDGLEPAGAEAGTAVPVTGLTNPAAGEPSRRSGGSGSSAARPARRRRRF